MKLEEMKAIADARFGQDWQCADFLKMASKNWDKLMAVVEAAKAIDEKRSEEEITDYPLENFFNLHKAFRELEQE